MLVVLLMAITRYMSRGAVVKHVEDLLKIYDFHVETITCSGGFLSRAGHCTFTYVGNADYVARLLEVDLEARRPKLQNQMEEKSLGSGGCAKLFPSVSPITPRSQLGGGITGRPYLGRLYLAPIGHGCLEFEYGYG